MRIFISLLFYWCFQVTGFGQVRVILDTDIDSDVDDVQAVAMVHALADQKKIKLLGIIVTSDDPYAPLCVSALNQHFRRPRLPVGFLKNQQEIIHREWYRYLLMPHKAAVVVPDNVLCGGPTGEKVRKKLLETTDVPTILRLPTGIFYSNSLN